MRQVPGQMFQDKLSAADNLTNHLVRVFLPPGECIKVFIQEPSEQKQNADTAVVSHMQPVLLLFLCVLPFDPQCQIWNMLVFSTAHFTISI